MDATELLQTCFVLELYHFWIDVNNNYGSVNVSKTKMISFKPAE